MSTTQVAITLTFATLAEANLFLAKQDGTPSGTKTTSKVAEETTGKTADKPKTTTKPKGITQEQMETALNEVLEKFDVPTARGIIAEFGGVKKKDDIPQDKYKAVHDACQEKLAEAEAGGEDGGEDGGI